MGENRCYHFVIKSDNFPDLKIYFLSEKLCYRFAEKQMARKSIFKKVRVH